MALCRANACRRNPPPSFRNGLADHLAEPDLTHLVDAYAVDTRLALESSRRTERQTDVVVVLVGLCARDLPHQLSIAVTASVKVSVLPGVAHGQDAGLVQRDILDGFACRVERIFFFVFVFDQGALLIQKLWKNGYWRFEESVPFQVKQYIPNQTG